MFSFHFIVFPESQIFLLDLIQFFDHQPTEAQILLKQDYRQNMLKTMTLKAFKTDESSITHTLTLPFLTSKQSPLAAANSILTGKSFHLYQLAQ